jgi:hypothetical protein
MLDPAWQRLVIVDFVNEPVDLVGGIQRMYLQSDI